MHPAIARRWGRYQLRLAAGHAALGRPEDALRHATAALRHVQQCTDLSTELVAAYDIIATCQQELGQLDAAAAARQNASDILERTAPGTTASTLALVRLGDLVRFQGHFDHAEEILTRALAGAPTDAAGDGPPVRALVLNALGIVYKDTGRYHASEVAYAEALEHITTACPPDDPAQAGLWHNIAGLAHARGQADQAATAAARAVEIRERALGPDHHLVAQDLAVHGAALLELGRTAEAEQLFGRALMIFRARDPADQYDVAVNLSNLAACHLQRNDGVGAEALFREGLVIKQAIFGGHHPEIARQLNNLAVAVAAQHRLHEATDLHREALSIAQHALPAHHPLTQACLQNVAISEEQEPTRTTC
jgi:tetratricopeptide (TPR) repeat protein